MIVAASLGRRVARISTKVGERNEVLRICVRRQESGHGVRDIWKNLEMTGQRIYIRDLDRHRWRQLILHGEVAAHRVRRDVVELDTQQTETVRIHCQRIEW